MKRLFLCLLLAFMMLAVPAAAQESGAYVPGRLAAALFQDAFADGKMVCAQVDMDFDVDLSKMGFATEEEKAIGEAVYEILNNAVFAFAAGNTPDGFVLDIAGQYAAGEAEPVYADVRIGINHTGLFAETSLLPDERMVISWETAFALAQVDPQISQQALALLAMEPAQLQEMISATLTQLAEQSEALIATLSQLSEPYLETIFSHIENLPMQINEDVAGDEYYPAAAQELVVAVSAKDLGALLIALADQLEQDTTLATVLNLALSQVPETAGITVASLCAQLREIVSANLTDEENPLCIYIGMDDAENLLYICFNVNLANGAPAILNIFFTPDETGMHTQLYLDAYALDGQGIPSGAALSMDYISDPNPQVHDLSAGFYLYTGDEAIVTLEFAGVREETVTEEGVNGYIDSIGFYMGTNVDTEAVEITVYENSESAPNAEGGEYRYTVSSMDLRLGEETTHSEGTQTLITAMTEDGPAGVYSEFVQAPDMGMSAESITWDLYTKAYAPLENPTVTVIGEADDAALEALALRFLTNVQAPMDALFAQLPTEILMLIGAPLAPGDAGVIQSAPQEAPQQPSVIDGLELVPQDNGSIQA